MSLLSSMVARILYAGDVDNSHEPEPGQTEDGVPERISREDLREMIVEEIGRLNEARASKSATGQKTLGGGVEWPKGTSVKTGRLRWRRS